MKYLVTTPSVNKESINSYSFHSLRKQDYYDMGGNIPHIIMKKVLAWSVEEENIDEKMAVAYYQDRNQVYIFHVDLSEVEPRFDKMEQLPAKRFGL